MSRVAVFPLLFCGVLFVTKDVVSEFQMARMSTSHRRIASKILSRCKNHNNRLTNETTLCESHVRTLTQSTRCRSLNVHLEMTEARLDRLEEFMILRQLESLQLFRTDCQVASPSSLSEIQRLEAEKLGLQQAISELAQSLEDEEARQRTIVLETDALKEEENALDCEFDRLEAERRLLETQLELQTTALEVISSQKEVQTELTLALEAAAAEQERAVELCQQQTVEHQQSLASCQEQVTQMEAQLEALQGPAPEIQAALEGSLTACLKETGLCDNTTSGCAAELETASDQLVQREMATLAERGRLQGCQRELIASRGRFSRCRGTGRRLYGEIQDLKREALEGTSSADRLEHCYEDSSICGSRTATCAQKLNKLRSGETACKTETSAWRVRWQRCNDSIHGLKHDQLAPLQATAKQLEVVVNDTVTRGRQCEDDSLHTRADRGFAEEELARSQVVLKAVKEQLAECKLGCGPEEKTEDDGKAYIDYDKVTEKDDGKAYIDYDTVTEKDDGDAYIDYDTVTEKGDGEAYINYDMVTEKDDGEGYIDYDMSGW